ncbi:hypothetical protein AB1K70_25860 [Bremerella sp. JC770]|uniref:hypothetical protein n=1 Tax=Bremerella sp. JC770 TaxID=3232137 RepID=UPI00345B36A6
MSFSGNDVSNVQLFQMHVSLLESFFGREWLEAGIRRRSQHPAIKNLLLAHAMCQNNGRIPTSPAFLMSVMPDVVRLLFDGIVLSKASGGNTSSFTLGDFANYGDDEVRKRIDAIKKISNEFNSLMTELAYGAWHQMRGHKVTAYDAKCLPDFRVDHHKLPLPIITDCKRIGQETLPSRYKRVVAKTNKQIKALGIDGYGLALLDVSEKTRTVATQLNDNAVPQAVEEAVDCIQRELVHCHKSVSEVVIQWDECAVLGQDKPGGWMKALVTMRRRHRIIPHPNARFPLKERLPIYPEFTTMLGVK